ncbi:serine/threonine-protein phosphatase PP1 isozyme 2 [Tanacetum coccineum]
MVNTRNSKPHVLDDALRNVVLKVVQEANASVNATLTIIQSNVTSLTDLIEGLLMFQNFAREELRKIVSFFIGGLKGEISMPSRMFKPTILKDAFCLARMYTSGHKCPSQMHSLEVSVDDWEEEVEVVDNGDIRKDIQEQVYLESFPQISLHALSGVNTFQTMRVRSYVGKQPLPILIDYGSTHNFLDSNTAKKLPYKLTATTPLRVDMANGNKMISSFECNQFKWTLQGYEYKGNCMLLPLGRCDMRTVLRGSQNGSLQWIQDKQIIIKGQWKQAQLASMIVCVYPTQLMQVQREMADTTTSNLHLQHLLSEYVDVFEMSIELLPQRTYDHAINLLPNTPPVTVRPYKLPLNQKDVMEQMVKELLEAGVIRESQSSFSSPIFMVKKRDATWRICVDYMQLNKFTIKDKFPIPMLKELIDELCGAQLFSKLDLRAFATFTTSFGGLAIDTLKIQAMQSWPILTTLKKNGFHLSTEAEFSFSHRKKAMMTTPILALPNFEKEFVVETDALGCGIGVVLHQDSQPIA